jgi:hypothetical protein
VRAHETAAAAARGRRRPGGAHTSAREERERLGGPAEGH